MSLKLKLFMYGFRAYTYLLFYTRILFNYMVNKVISTVPDHLICPLFSINKQNRSKVSILIAKGVSKESETSINVTNSVNLFLNLYWDNEACDDTGGIQLYKLKEIFNHVNLLWVCYLYDCKGLHTKSEYIIPNLKYMFIDLKTSKIYKYNLYNIEPLEFLFDQVPFNPDFKWS
jgi:hypothetical protein